MSETALRSSDDQRLEPSMGGISINPIEMPPFLRSGEDQMTRNGITLPAAALRLRKGYVAARNLIMRGDVLGWQDKRGRGFVWENDPHAGCVLT